MAWTGSICDYPIAYRATRSAQVGDTDLAMGTSDITTVAVAQATALTNANNMATNHVSQIFYGVNVARGFKVASNMGGTFGSTFTALYNSLPTNSTSAKAMMISGS